MTTQEAYETCRQHFTGRVNFAVTPDVPNADPPQCVYRAEKDAHSPTRCGIGAMIPDALYSSTFEGCGVAVLIEMEPVMRGFFYGVDQAFLQATQNLHDRYAHAANESGLTNRYATVYDLLRKAFVRELDDLAASHGLTVADR